MKIVGQILLACILLALLQYVVIAALMLLFAGLLWGALFRPQETFGLLAMLLVSGLVGAHPVACLVLVGALLALPALIRRPRCRRIRPVTPPPALPAPPGGGVWPAGVQNEGGDG